MCLLVSSFRMLTEYWGIVPYLAGKGSNADKVQDSDTSLLVSNKADKTAKEDYLEDSETTPKSCLGLVFELLATSACTSY